MSPALTFSSQKQKGPKSSRLLMGKRINRRDSDPPRPSLACVSTDLCSPSTFLAQADEHVVTRNPHAGGHWVLPPPPTTRRRRRAPLPTCSSRAFCQPPQGLIFRHHLCSQYPPPGRSSPPPPPAGPGFSPAPTSSEQLSGRESPPVPPAFSAASHLPFFPRAQVILSRDHSTLRGSTTSQHHGQDPAHSCCR